MKGYKAPFLQIVNTGVEATEEEEGFVLFPKALLAGKTAEEVQELRALYRVAYEKAVKKVQSSTGDFFNGEGI